jgi:hydrogenase nickel incorporation protein HypA/HybF
MTTMRKATTTWIRTTKHPMHEFGLMQSVLENVEASARKAGAERVTEIRLVVGEMREVVPETMEFAFEALAPDTLSADARLTVTRVSPRSRCLQCGQSFEHDRFHWACPACDSLATELLAGRELYIDAIEVDIPT